MAPLCAGGRFIGSVDRAEDVRDAEAIARACERYVRDDDDECYLDSGSPNCFDCRRRRWSAEGFACTEGMLGSLPG